ncbi:MAG: hypothetical protein JWO08_1186 [Verrucomicrobiaceae bacterium]|nr:hypothetical protein [Verrucomicrobiaceae bacterium]
MRASQKGCRCSNEQYLSSMAHTPDPPVLRWFVEFRENPGRWVLTSGLNPRAKKRTILEHEYDGLLTLLQACEEGTLKDKRGTVVISHPSLKRGLLYFFDGSGDGDFSEPGVRAER